MLTEDAIKEFQVLYEAEFGKKLSAEEALETAMRLMRLYKAVLKPLDPV